ncbi:alanine--tRNA ligase (plasmid) [Peribacillus psychrosaccharolyticus]|uniref:Alanine--tRNA ligase n=1 Tax=Peribacillus psychrosaccharolyticus TaxID=1407 RepID=A0A974NI40_PERPY|nr:alanine--tRNA ligase [Peribacillus psychrosaccharolyticus]MEC2054229.1 alanine--tRNA ligase [Peribacillus psychrosaccharolyticus]MED3746580.1 alanine--tRNA ligase [Peribacillus psychrosaccharolyticus]QQS98415.1 alanine--tRNA ligase [Peribacillus psychrosaccharolyticus]
MKYYTSKEIRTKYLEFFTEKEHKVISDYSVIPENDPTVLFTTAGMQPLVPYLLGEKHPRGARIANVQRCIRTGDIEEVGDDTHATFFEMLGNWSLGDYFKEESINWSWEFLTSAKWLDIPKEKLYFTVFEGDNDAPRDEESYSLWRSLGVAEDHLFFMPKSENWWGPAGSTGPCGPDTEMFYDTGKPKCSEACDPSCSCGKYVEIWNNVFMEYSKDENGLFSPLSQKNVDTGMGLERILIALNGGTIYDTDLFKDIVEQTRKLSRKNLFGENEEKSLKIIADHLRTSTIIIGDRQGVTPSNTDQGYVIRRLIRRAIRHANLLEIPTGSITKICELVINQYGEVYPELKENETKIIHEVLQEEQKFNKTIQQGMKEFQKMLDKLDSKTKEIDGKSAFKLYDTYGFPIELTLELASEKGYEVNVQAYKDYFDEHRKKSQLGAEQKFKGGLADNSIETTRLHTATHLLHESLRRVLGDSIEQKGSNITTQRLRFDFSFNRKLTKEEITRVEEMVNDSIRSNYSIVNKQMTVEEAKQEGAIGLFESKYGDIVNVYSIGDFSKEICGGPHTKSTEELGIFKIKKEESSSSGVRRIKAVLL